MNQLFAEKFDWEFKCFVIQNGLVLIGRVSLIGLTFYFILNWIIDRFSAKGTIPDLFTVIGSNACFLRI